MSASVVEDYYRAWRPNASETQLAVVAKIVACICGIVAFSFVYVADVMDNIFSVSIKKHCINYFLAEWWCTQWVLLAQPFNPYLTSSICNQSNLIPTCKQTNAI